MTENNNAEVFDLCQTDNLDNSNLSEDTEIITAESVIEDNRLSEQKVQELEDKQANDNLPAPLPAYENALAIPTEPLELADFITKGSAFVSATSKLLKQPGAEFMDNYKEVLRHTQDQSALVLEAELQLVKIISAAPQKLKKSDPKGTLTQKGIKDNLKIGDKKLRLMKQLTAKLVKEAVEYAQKNGDVPTRYLALKIKADTEAAKRKDEKYDREAEAKVKAFEDEKSVVKADDFTDKKFDVIYADLSILGDTLNFADAEEILEKAAADDAMLFLWVMPQQMPDAFNFIGHSSFKYIEQVVWNKNKGNAGTWVKGMHDVLLICQKGKYSKPNAVERFVSVYSELQGDSDNKPDYFYDVIEAICPDASYLEVFSTRKYSDKWTIFDNRTDEEKNEGNENE